MFNLFHRHKKNVGERQPSSSVPNFERLDFNISKEVKDAISKANENVDKYVYILKDNCLYFSII